MTGTWRLVYLDCFCSSQPNVSSKQEALRVAREDMIPRDAAAAAWSAAPIPNQDSGVSDSTGTRRTGISGWLSWLFGGSRAFNRGKPF